MMDEIVWIICNTLFLITMIFNYFFLKRPNDESIFERVLFWTFGVFIAYANSITSVFFYKIKESISETLSASQIGNYQYYYHYHINYIYCLSLMMLSLVLLMDALIKTKRRKFLPYLSYTVLGGGFLISLVYYFFFAPHAFRGYDMGIAITYLFLYAVLSVFLSYYFFIDSGKKLIIKIMLAFGTIAFALELISLTIQFSLQSLIYFIIIDFILIGFTGIYYSKTKKRSV